MFKCRAFSVLLILLVFFLFASCKQKPGDIPESPSAVPTVTATAEPTIEPTPTATAPTESPDATVEPPVTASPPVTSETDSPAKLAETEDAGQEYIDRAIFLGDSTSYGLKYYGVLSGGQDTRQVWTPASGTLTLSNQGFATIVYPDTGEEIPIRDAVELEMPEIMIITLGVNGISFMEEEYFKSEYKSLVEDIKDISPDTKIILQSIFPIASNYEYQGDINNTKIQAANGWILEMAEETGVKYLDTISVLLGDDGFLPQDYHNGDGLHFNEYSFNIVIDYIRTHGYQ